MKDIKYRKLDFILGQSFFEVILALAVSAVIIMGIVSLTSKSVMTSSNSKNKAQANRYASEAVEYLRSRKEMAGWSDFKSKLTSGDWCIPTLPANLPFSDNSTCHSTDLSDFIPGTIFQRSLVVVPYPPAPQQPRSLEVRVKVVWTDEKGTHETYTVSSISDW